MKELFDSWGIWWDATVIALCIAAFIIWIEVVIGNRVRDKATSYLGILIEQAANWYAKRKNIAKARARHVAYGKQYHVVILGARYHVINKGQRQRINRLLKKYHLKITIEKLLQKAVYSTK